MGGLTSTERIFLRPITPKCYFSISVELIDSTSNKNSFIV